VLSAPPAVFKSAYSVQPAEAVRTNSAPQLGFGFANVVSASSALEKLIKICKISAFSAHKIFHKISM